VQDDTVLVELAKGQTGHLVVAAASAGGVVGVRALGHCCVDVAVMEVGSSVTGDTEG